MVVFKAYCIGVTFGGGKFSESSAIHQPKLSNLVAAYNNHLDNLFVRQNFLAKIVIHTLLPNINAAKLSHSITVT